MNRILAWMLIALGAWVFVFLLLDGMDALHLLGASLAFTVLAGGGCLLLRWASKFSRVSARFTPASLELTAPCGHLVGGNGKLGSASIPWLAVEGIQLLDVPATEGLPDHQVCFLYSTHGDFTIHSLHWDRHGELVDALISRSGRTPGSSLPSRPGAQSRYTAGERMTLSVLRVLGWAGLAASLLFFWFLAENLWKRGFNWSDAGMVPAFLTMLGGSYALSRIRTR